MTDTEAKADLFDRLTRIADTDGVIVSVGPSTNYGYKRVSTTARRTARISVRNPDPATQGSEAEPVDGYADTAAAAIAQAVRLYEAQQK